MNRVPKNLIASALVFIFILAVGCITLATPAEVLASQMPDCSTPGSVLDPPCQRLLCNLAASHNLLSQGALVSTRSYDSAKGGPLLLGDVVAALSRNDISLTAKQLRTIWPDYPPPKVPLHLFNSVLTL